MIHIYHLDGMTCNGCRSHVEEILSKVEGVSQATVNLETKEATIAMESHIPIETFQKALKEDGGRYSIHNLGEAPEMKDSDDEIPASEGIMIHTYHIEGMTCNGCRSHVEEILSKVEGVSQALVNLETDRKSVV